MKNAVGIEADLVFREGRKAHSQDAVVHCNLREGISFVGDVRASLLRGCAGCDDQLLAITRNTNVFLCCVAKSDDFQSVIKIFFRDAIHKAIPFLAYKGPCPYIIQNPKDDFTIPLYFQAVCRQTNAALLE